MRAHAHGLRMRTVTCAWQGIRKAMFNQMMLANAVPHFAYCDEVRMDAVMAMRLELKELAGAPPAP